MWYRARGTEHGAQGENDCKTAGPQDRRTARLKAQGGGKVMQVLQVFYNEALAKVVLDESPPRRACPA